MEAPTLHATSDIPTHSERYAPWPWPLPGGWAIKQTNVPNLLRVWREECISSGHVDQSIGEQLRATPSRSKLVGLAKK